MRDAEVCSMRATIAMKDAWTHPCDASMQIMIYCCFACSVVELGGNGMMNRLQAPVDPLGKASDGCWLAQYFACVSTLSACCAERWARNLSSTACDGRVDIGHGLRWASSAQK